MANEKFVTLEPWGGPFCVLRGRSQILQGGTRGVNCGFRGGLRRANVQLELSGFGGALHGQW